MSAPARRDSWAKARVRSAATLRAVARTALHVCDLLAARGLETHETPRFWLQAVAEERDTRRLTRSLLAWARRRTTVAAMLREGPSRLTTVWASALLEFELTLTHARAHITQTERCVHRSVPQLVRVVHDVAGEPWEAADAQVEAWFESALRTERSSPQTA